MKIKVGTNLRALMHSFVTYTEDLRSIWIVVNRMKRPQVSDRDLCRIEVSVASTRYPFSRLKNHFESVQCLRERFGYRGSWLPGRTQVPSSHLSEWVLKSPIGASVSDTFEGTPTARLDFFFHLFLWWKWVAWFFNPPRERENFLTHKFFFLI